MPTNIKRFDTVGKKENWSAAMVSADSCAYVEDYAAPVFKQNASCRAVYEYAKEHLPQYSKVLLAMRWGSQMPENSHSLAYDADFFKNSTSCCKNFLRKNKRFT